MGLAEIQSKGKVTRGKSEKAGQGQVVNGILCHAKEFALRPVEKKGLGKMGFRSFDFYIFCKGKLV